MFISFLIKGGSLFIGLFTTPAYIAYFSNDAVLGVWFTILSVLSWILSFDMGIGNGVRNRLAEALGSNNLKESKRIISSAYIFLSGLSMLIILVASCAFPFVNWNSLLGITTTQLATDALQNAVTIVFISIILQFVLRLITSISYAIQNAYVSSLLHLCTNVLLLIYVLTANHLGRNGSIVTLAIVYSFAVNIPLLITTFILFSSKLKEIRPNPKFFNYNCAKSVLKLGVGFLYLQFVAMLLDNTASFLISNLTGAEQVVDYQLYHKLFSLVGMIISITIIPMWSAITKAYVEKRYTWLKKAIKLLFGVVVLSLLVQLVVVALLQFLFDLWLGKQVMQANYWIALLFALYGTCTTWQQVCSYVQNGLGKIKLQAFCISFAVIVSFSFSFVFAKAWGSYVAVVLGIVMGYIPSCLIQTIWISRFFKKLKSDG